MGYFPFYMDIKNENCLVVGGGTVALRKVEKLLPFEPVIKVVAPVICRDIADLGVEMHRRAFDDSDLDDVFAVITATDCPELNRHIFELCRQRHILVNTVDDIHHCGFIFPAIVKRKNITIGISTEGKSPLYAQYLRQKTESIIDENCDKITDILSSCRQIIKREIPTEENRKKALEAILRLCIDNTDSVSETIIETIIGEYR